MRRRSLRRSRRPSGSSSGGTYDMPPYAIAAVSAPMRGATLKQPICGEVLAAPCRRPSPRWIFRGVPRWGIGPSASQGREPKRQDGVVWVDLSPRIPPSPTGEAVHFGALPRRGAFVLPRRRESRGRQWVTPPTGEVLDGVGVSEATRRINAEAHASFRRLKGPESFSKGAISQSDKAADCGGFTI